MDSTDRDLKQKHDIEQMAVIGKIYNMQWLKSNSQFSGHTKVFPDENELVCTPATNKASKGSKNCTDVASAEDAANSSRLENDDGVINQHVDNNNIVTNNNTLEPTLKVVELVEESIMETAWNKNVNIASSVLPNSQEMKKMNAQENIINVPLERLRLVEEEKMKSNKSCNESSNKWDTIHSTSDSTKADNDESNRINSKQCHDNNNNNAKSKAQTAPELQKGMQKITTKININKTNDHKVKRQPGNSMKVSCTKQISKDQDDSLHSYKTEKISSTDSRKISVPVFKYDKCNKVNGCNRQLIMGKGTQMKEQQFYKQNFSTYNDSGDGRKSMEGLDEKNRSRRRSNETDEPRKCHKVQINRSQSYNVQYNRNKPLVKSQQQYLRDTTKEEENSIHHSSGFNDNAAGSLNSAENVSKKKCEIKCNTTERPTGKPSGSVPCRRSYQNLSHAKTSSDRSWKGDQGYVQKFKKDSHIYRRSSGTFQPFPKDTSGKEKPDDYKKAVPDNSSKDYRASQSEGSRITACPLKAANGAINNKTDSSDSTVNNQHSTRSLNPCSNGTKDPATISASVHMLQESSHLLQVAPCNGTEVQFAKTEQDHPSNNNSGKTSIGSSEMKSVKFSDSIQEINTAVHSAPSLHTSNIIQHHKIATNSYYSDLQPTPSVSNAQQQLESHQSVQIKSYLDNGGAQMANQSSVQNPERNMYLLDIAHQKSDQQSNCSIAMGNSMSYHNVSPVYFNQYNNAQNTPRKTTDSSIVSHSGLMPATSSYTMENPSIMQDEPPNILMHSTQTSVLPAPSGYQNHPSAGQHNQWNVSLPDMLLYGNVMNSTHPLNMQLQNSRHVCNTDYNGIQQGYVQCPLFYMPQLCMQGWNPMMQYPPLFQNTTYTNCSAFPNQVLPSSTTADSINCSVATSMQSNPYKQFQQVQQLESNPSFSVPVKLDSYIGSLQTCKSNVKIKDNNVDVRARSSQYRVPLANDYQGCTQDGGQATGPYSYGVSMDPARNVSTNMHLLSQKYAPRAAANCQKMPEHCSTFQSNLDRGNRKDDAKNDSECTPPMVSPRECMYYGVNYSRKLDVVQNPTLRTENKSMAYMSGVNPQTYAPQYHKNGNYHASPKELASRATFARGIRKTMEQ